MVSEPDSRSGMHMGNLRSFTAQLSEPSIVSVRFGSQPASWLLSGSTAVEFLTAIVIYQRSPEVYSKNFSAPLAIQKLGGEKILGINLFGDE